MFNHASLCADKVGFVLFTPFERHTLGDTEMTQGTQKQRDWLTTLLLSFFLGCFGIHRFYTGHITTGIIQFLTLGGCGIWAIYDIIMIATGNFKDIDGQPLHKK